MKNGKVIYLDYQATTPLDSDVLSMMHPYLAENYGNPHSVEHAMGWVAAKAVEQAVEKIAGLIGADSDEIIFTSGATESNNLALLGLARGNKNPARRRILIAATEHKCVLDIGRVLQEQLGFKIDIVPVDRRGFIDPSDLEDRLGDDVLAVSVMAVNNEVGTIQDIGAISRLVFKYGAIFHSDAAQAPCAIDLTFFADRVDLLSLSGHKMYGPKGIGALYVRREIQSQIEPLIYGGGQQNGLRSGTLPTALCVGLGAAADLIKARYGVEERHRIAQLRDSFIDSLQTLCLPIRVNGPECGSQKHPGNANIEFVGRNAQDILGALQPRLAASTGSACSSGIPEPSHVLRAIGLSSNSAEASIRFSLGHELTETDMADAITHIANAVETSTQ